MTAKTTTATRTAPVAPSPEEMAKLDAPLSGIGFQFETISPSLVSGRFTVSPLCCQPFNMLHGGVSALVAEGLASMGAVMASGFQRVAGVQLSINHHRPAALGEVVVAEARPVSVGKNIQVWEVELRKEALGEEEEKGALLASSRMTLLANLPMPEGSEEVSERLRKHAKL